jgi:hypothetical protein
MKSNKICDFGGCGKPIEMWEIYCKEHHDYMKKLKTALNILDVHYHDEEKCWRKNNV